MKSNNKDSKKSGIYCIRNVVNNKVYIGRAVDIHRRILQHITALNLKDVERENIHFISAWHKYKPENFEYFVIEYLPDDILLLEEREYFWIEVFESKNRKKGYNKVNRTIGYMCSQELKDKLSHLGKLRYENAEERLKVSERSIRMWKNKEYRSRIVESKTKFTIIHKLDKVTNSIIETFTSFVDVIDKYPNYNGNHIYSAATGRKPSAYGFKWKAISKND